MRMIIDIIIICNIVLDILYTKYAYAEYSFAFSSSLVIENKAIWSELENEKGD